MRTIPFKEVLHAVADKMGLDPEQSNFLSNQAIPIGKSIDQWVNRVYDAKDFPEWTQIREFTPDANHIVPWGNTTASLGGVSVQIGRVLSVYLIDPRTTDAPVETDFTENDVGIHCGFEHGTSVWIKFLPPPPRYTSEQWRPEIGYARGDVVYSDQTGQVYKSKVNQNRGHDPSVTFQPPPNVEIMQPPIQLPAEVVTQLTKPNPGALAQNQITRVTLAIIGGTDTVPAIPDPPPNLSQFYISAVEPKIPGTFIDAATTLTDGVMTLLDVLNDLFNNLVAALSPDGYTITKDDANLTIDLERAAQFESLTLYIPVGGPNYYLVQQQIQPYIAAVAATDGEKQKIEVTLTEADVTPGAIYTLNFKDVTGVDHVVTYEAGITDTANQILAGLANQIGTLGGSDTFFMGISSELDTTALTAAFSSATEISLGANLLLPGSPWWELVPFPITISNTVIRGGFADLLKEWSQTDKGMAEEQNVPSELQTASSKFSSTPNPELTNQQMPYSRYKIS